MTFDVTQAKPLYVLKSSDVINRYQGLINVAPYFEGIKSIALYEDQQGLMQWLPTVLGDSFFYERLSKRVNPYYPAKKTEYDSALQFVCESGLVLEIGCGEGHFGAMLPLGQWYGVDINPAAIQSATSKGLPCKTWNFIDDNVDSLPVAAIDMICSFQTIEHLPDPSLLFKFSAKTLRSGGKLLIGAPAHESLLGRFPLAPLNIPPHHQTWWTDRALEKFPVQFGFECKRIHHCEVDLFHKRWFFHQFVNHAIQARVNALPLKTRRITMKVASKLISVFSRLLVDDSTPFDPFFGTRGQSVLALYERI
jgi:SAM-dependent methyltransferase